MEGRCGRVRRWIIVSSSRIHDDGSRTRRPIRQCPFGCELSVDHKGKDRRREIRRRMNEIPLSKVEPTKNVAKLPSPCFYLSLLS